MIAALLLAGVVALPIAGLENPSRWASEGATALSGESGQVRCLPATTVAYGSKPSTAFSLTAIKMPEKAFVRTGEAATDFD